MAHFWDLPLEIRVMIYRQVPLAVTRHPIPAQGGTVILITEGVDIQLRLVCHWINMEIKSLLLNRGPSIFTRIPRIKVEGCPWDLLIMRRNRRWSGIVAAALDWFTRLYTNRLSPHRGVFWNWLRSSGRLPPIFQTISGQDRRAIVRWIYQAGFILDASAADPEIILKDTQHRILLPTAFMYNIERDDPRYLEPQDVFYPRLQKFAYELGIVVDMVHTETADDDPAVEQEFTLCDFQNAWLMEQGKYPTTGPTCPDLAFWRDLVFFDIEDIKSPHLVPYPDKEIKPGSSGDEEFQGETYEGSVETWVSGWGIPV